MSGRGGEEGTRLGEEDENGAGGRRRPLPPSISEFFKPPASPSTEIMAAAASTLTACKVGYSSSGRKGFHSVLDFL